jgi:hypothetical protein
MKELVPLCVVFSRAIPSGLAFVVIAQFCCEGRGYEKPTPLVL